MAKSNSNKNTKETPKNTLRFCCGAAHRNALIFFFFPLFAAKVMRYSCNELFSGVFFFKPESLLTQLYIPFFPQLNTIIAFYVTVHIFFSIFFYPHCFFSSRKPKQKPKPQFDVNYITASFLYKSFDTQYCSILCTMSGCKTDFPQYVKLHYVSRKI